MSDDNQAASTQELLNNMDRLAQTGDSVDPNLNSLEMNNTQQLVTCIDKITSTQNLESASSQNIVISSSSMNVTSATVIASQCNQTITDHEEKVLIIGESIQCNEPVNANQTKHSDQISVSINDQTQEEPASKKARTETTLPKQASQVSASNFQFIPRTVSKGKSDSFPKKPDSNISVKCLSQTVEKSAPQRQSSQVIDLTFDSEKQLNKSQDSLSNKELQSQDSVIDLTTDPEKQKEAEYKENVSNKGKQHKDSSSSESEVEFIPPYLMKSYDANVILPEDVVRTWRTESSIQEGEIVEIDRECTGPYTTKPVCCGRVVTDFMSSDDKNYLRGCKWSPDGKYLLTNSNDNRLRVYCPSTETPSSQKEEDMQHIAKAKESDTVYDFCWYNKMVSDDQETCCFLTTCKDSPVHMWDMTTGDLKCTYRPYNHLDEVCTAHSLALSSDGKKLYTGFNKMIRVFDVSRPGRDCIQRQTFSKHQGQPGIISCISPSPEGNGIYAAGSYSRGIALYHEPKGDMICMFQGQQGGVTHIAFSPDGTKLYSGGRKDPEILCWDLRKPGHILFVALRLCETNQRMYFDQDSSGRHLFSGCHDGTVCVWDTTKPPVKVLSESDPLLKPVMKFKAHADCVNGISYNHMNGQIATCSGQRHYPDLCHDDGDSDTDSITNDCIENTVKLWKFKS